MIFKNRQKNMKFFVDNPKKGFLGEKSGKRGMKNKEKMADKTPSGKNFLNLSL
jgi:hypothetical protein